MRLVFTKNKIYLFVVLTAVKSTSLLDSDSSSDSKILLVPFSPNNDAYDTLFPLL